ncbi:MAG TPA: beta-L-arabinofuranosidase domain-containing protein, partial [Paludibacter sp.]
EIFADAYQMTGTAKYLTAAKRFSHKVLLNSMAVNSDNLDNMHANTQVPKAVGFQRIAEVSKDATYIKAAQFFWQTVTANRSLASGANSRKEYFPQATAYSDYVNVPEGPESCNTNNMLKMTEDLFRVSPQAKYADYFERALYNHILSTQHPDHGGYVYFTPARPRHYRVYSAPNQAMWCCVGTGMENHGKYGEFIYTHQNDSLYLNLFIASELNWKDKGVKIRQETKFPEEEKTKLIVSVTTPTAFKLMVRSPKWVKAGMLKIVVNTDTLAVQSVPQTYIAINRTWNNGDSVRILLPMENTIEQLPNVTSYVALLHGPILLGAKTGTEDLLGLVADDSRWGHIANGTLLPLDKAPVIVSDKASIASKITPVAGKPLTFTAPALFVTKADSALVLEPFYKIHDSRYMMYWMALSKAQYQTVVDSLAAVQKAALELELRTVDKVAPGEQQPEVDHKLLSLNSYTGNYQNEFWRDARAGGYISYSMLTGKKSDLSLMVRYWGNETGSRSFDILIDGVKLTTENIVGKWNVNQFKNVEYPIPNSMTSGKDTITVKFQAINTSNVVGGLFYVRLLQPLSATDVQPVYNRSDWKVFTRKNNIVVNGLAGPSTIFVYDSCGHTLNIEKSKASSVIIPAKSKGIRIVKVVSGGNVQVNKVIVE